MNTYVHTHAINEDIPTRVGIERLARVVERRVRVQHLEIVHDAPPRLCVWMHCVFGWRGAWVWCVLGAGRPIRRSPNACNTPSTPNTNQSAHHTHHQSINPSMYQQQQKKSAPAGAPAGGAGGQWRPRTSKRRTPGRNTPSPQATPTPTRDPGRSRPWCCPMRCRLFDCWCCRCCCWCVAPWPGLLAGSLGWGAPVLGRVVGNKGRIQSVRRIIRRMRSQLWPCGTAGLVWLGLVCVTTES